MSRAAASAHPAAAPGRAAGLAWGMLGMAGFSVSLPMTRLAVAGGLDPGFVGIGRAAVAGLLAVLVLGFGRSPLLPPGLGWRMVLPRLALIVAGVVFGFPLLTAMALARVPAAHGIVVAGLLPAATAAMAVLRAGERPSPGFWLAAVSGLVCVLLFAWTQGAGRLDRADLWLLAAVLLCGLGYAEGGVLARRLGGARVISLALAASLPLTLGITLLRLDPARLAAASGAAWIGFAWVSLVSMYLGFFAWYRGLALGGVARIGQLQLAQPALSLLWAALFLGERITLPTLAASAAVMACIVATQRAR